MERIAESLNGIGRMHSLSPNAQKKSAKSRSYRLMAMHRGAAIADFEVCFVETDASFRDEPARSGGRHRCSCELRKFEPRIRKVESD